MNKILIVDDDIDINNSTKANTDDFGSERKSFRDIVMNRYDYSASCAGQNLDLSKIEFYMVLSVYYACVYFNCI